MRVWILPHLQANKLDFFMDGGKGQTPSWETKNFITYGTSNMMILAPRPHTSLNPLGKMGQSLVDVTSYVFALKPKNT